MFRTSRLPFTGVWHLSAMSLLARFAMPSLNGQYPGTQAEPMPPRIKEPPNPSENPDAPVREPDPETPEQI